jgi:hypothetical protein
MYGTTMYGTTMYGTTMYGTTMHGTTMHGTTIKILQIYLQLIISLVRGPGSVVDIVTGYGLDGPGVEFRWRRDFPHLSITALGPTQPPVNGYRVFPGGEKWPGRDADPSPPSSAVVMKG